LQSERQYHAAVVDTHLELEGVRQAAAIGAQQ
jgi:hypothetical protein